MSGFISTIPLSSAFYYEAITVTAFTISYTMIFIALYSRMSDIMPKDKMEMTGAIATFKDLGYTIGPLLAGALIGAISIRSTFLLAGAAFILLLPIALLLHDQSGRNQGASPFGIHFENLFRSVSRLTR